MTWRGTTPGPARLPAALHANPWGVYSPLPGCRYQVQPSVDGLQGGGGGGAHLTAHHGGRRNVTPRDHAWSMGRRSLQVTGSGRLLEPHRAVSRAAPAEASQGNGGIPSRPLAIQ